MSAPVFEDEKWREDDQRSIESVIQTEPSCSQSGSMIDVPHYDLSDGSNNVFGWLHTYLDAVVANLLQKVCFPCVGIAWRFAYDIEELDQDGTMKEYTKIVVAKLENNSETVERGRGWFG